EQAARLARERKARVAAGLEAPLLNARAAAADTGIHGLAGLRTRDHFVLDPYRAALGLAAAASARGARLFERSPVTRTRFRPKWVDVQTARGTLRAGTVIVATGAPGALFAPLRRHVRVETRFMALT